MKKIIILLVIISALAGGAYFMFAKKKPEAAYKTAKIERGTIISSVSATGNLTAVVTVQVGTQVSGTIQKLLVDFNSKVKKGQTIAQIDPSLFSAQVEQAKGSFLNAQANVEKSKADLADAKRSFDRNKKLLQDGIIAQGDFDTSENRLQMAVATLKASEASVTQTRGTYTQAQTNLRYSTITSPVDGIIINRNVDVGQTVAASFQTPTLFTIAQDLTKMEIDTSVDESDVSRVKVGQPVTFTVDAYPETKFHGKVAQIRNAPVTTQNVVTYIVVVSVSNKELKLKPGMTANVSIETARKEDVLKIPSAALRFKPKAAKDAKNEKPSSPGKPAEGEKMLRKKENGQQVFIPGPEGKPKPVKVVTGISNDGQVELIEGSLKENDEVITEQISTQKKPSGMSGGSPMGPRF